MRTEFFTHLMFEGQAQEAMDLYLSAFDDAEVNSVEHFPNDHEHLAGKIRLAKFRLKNSEFLCIDSPTRHEFSFTPSMSIFVEFDDETELKHVLSQLSVEGKTLMPLDNYGFSELFVWFQDRFGVSWQLNLR